MNELLNAIKADLAQFDYPTWLWRADEVTGIYLILSAPAWDGAAEQALGATDDVDTTVRVTAVTGTTTGVVTMLDRIRGLLSPQRLDHQVPLAGRHVLTRYVRSEFVDVDADTVIAHTTRHPAYGVDTYQLVAQPA